MLEIFNVIDLSVLSSNNVPETDVESDHVPLNIETIPDSPTTSVLL